MLDRKPDDYEKEAEFSLRFVDIDDAVRADSDYHSDDYFNEIMVKRERKVLQLIRDYLKNNDS